MYIDQSRTYFFVGLLFLVSRWKNKNFLLISAGFLILILASVRMGKSLSFVDAIMYGLMGEVYNATFLMGQIMNLASGDQFRIEYVLNLIFQPLSFLIQKFQLDLTNSPLMASALIFEKTGESPNPMGGGYVASYFIGASYFTPIIYTLYFLNIFLLSRFLFFNGSYHYYVLFMPIFIKSSPSVFINMILYVFIIFTFINALRYLFNNLFTGSFCAKLNK